MTSILRRALILLWLYPAFVLAAGIARADDPASVVVEATADPTSVTIGDRVRLILVARAPASVTLEEMAPLESVGLFEVLEQKSGAPVRSPDGGALMRVELTLAAFQTGALAIPPVGVTYADENGVRSVSHSQPISIAVRSVLGADPDPQLLDLKPPLTIPGRATSYTQTAATAALVASALAITVLMLRRRRPRATLRPLPASGFSIEAAAEAELDAIEAAGLLERGDYEAYYGRISLCLRTYMERRYRFPALSLTTTEMRRALEDEGVDRWQRRVFLGLIEECDSVRWAGYQPAAARASRALLQAREIVALQAPVGTAP